jgi:hypothetical protein
VAFLAVFPVALVTPVTSPNRQRSEFGLFTKGPAALLSYNKNCVIPHLPLGSPLEFTKKGLSLASPFLSVYMKINSDVKLSKKIISIQP